MIFLYASGKYQTFESDFSNKFCSSTRLHASRHRSNQQYPKLTDCWIDFVYFNHTQTGPNERVMNPHSGKPTLAACIPSSSNRICWARTLQFSRLPATYVGQFYSGVGHVSVVCHQSTSLHTDLTLLHAAKINKFPTSFLSNHPFAPFPLHALYRMCIRCTPRLCASIIPPPVVYYA